MAKVVATGSKLGKFVKAGHKCAKGWKKKVVRVKGHGKRTMCVRRKK